MDLIRLVKKHSALLLPIGITAGAILLFVPTLIVGKSVRSQMEESTVLGGQIDSLRQSTPPANQWKVEQAYQMKHAEDANAVSMLASQVSERELLVYGMFPEPNETSNAVFVNFGKVYRQAIEDMVVKSLRARDCPTEAEIADVTKLGVTGGAGQMGNFGVEAGSRNEAIIERLCKDRAESTPVYANPDIFSGYAFWDNYSYIGRNEAIEDCWKAQVAYWIQKDIVDTIAALDANSSSVLKSPIKRLVSIGFTSADKATAASRREGAVDMPRYVLSPTEGILTTPWTGRISNNEIDVVHFAVRVIVSNKAVQPFMKELCSQKTHTFSGWSGREPRQDFVHNQITILKSSIEPVSRAAAMGAMGMGVTSIDRYKYGDDAVVELNLVCEYLFSKAGYEKIKPKLISEKPAEENVPVAPRQPRAPRKAGSSGSTKKARGADEGF